MLLEKTEKLISNLHEYETLKELSNKSKDFKSRYKNVEELYDILQDVRKKKILFSENGIDSNLVDVFSGLNSLVQSLISFSKDDSSKLLETHEFWRTNYDYLAKEADKVLLFNWQSYINANLTYKDTNELEILRQIPSLSSSARKLQEYVGEVVEIKEELPTLEVIHKIKNISTEMEKFIDDLDKVGIPDEVSDFLTKASTVGISLADINSELMEWLKKNDMLQYCQIRLRNND